MADGESRRFEAMRRMRHSVLGVGVRRREAESDFFSSLLHLRRREIRSAGRARAVCG